MIKRSKLVRKHFLLAEAIFLDWQRRDQSKSYPALLIFWQIIGIYWLFPWSRWNFTKIAQIFLLRSSQRNFLLACWTAFPLVRDDCCPTICISLNSVNHRDWKQSKQVTSFCLPTIRDLVSREPKWLVVWRRTD